MGKDSRVGLRAQVFLVTVVVVVLAVLASGLYLERELRVATETRIENELHRHAKSSRELLRLTGAEWTMDEIDPIADRLGESIGARVTFIAEDGTVVGESERTIEELAHVENHGSRPEVIEARESGFGSDERRSATIGAEMVYVAVPFDVVDGPGEGGTVRVAMWNTEVDKAVAALRLLLFIAGLVAVALAVSVAFFVSGRMTRQLRELIDTAREASSTRTSLTSGVIPHGVDGARGGSIGGLAEELEGVVRDLAVERNRFQAVLKSMDEAVLAIDPGHKVIAANRAARKMLALRERVIGRSLLEVVRIPELESLATAALGGESQSTEFVLHDSGKTILARARPNVRGKDNDEEGDTDAEGAVLVLHDVTEVRRLETVRQDFVANVSHELRTPVSIIRAHTDTLLDGAVDDPDQARRFLEPVRRSAERLGQLISDLLDISRIDRGKYELERRALSVPSIVAFVSQSVAQRVKERGITLEIDVPEDSLVMGDRHALEQILINLVENAIKYGPDEGTVTLTAKFEEAEQSGMRIEVSDDGPGIAAEHRGRVFERFYRVDPGRSRAMGGTGLGLAIAKNLAEAMGGQVGLEPRLPRGTTFWVWLEAGPPAAAGDTEAP